MNPIIDFLKQTEGTVFVNEDGYKSDFKLKPPLTETELLAFETRLPCPLPDEMGELLRFARGFDGVLDGIDFVDWEGFGMEDIFPHARKLAADGYGNYWVVDLTHESKSFGPIFYACHDAPVVVYQTDSLLHFIREVVRFGNKPWQSEIDEVHETFSNRIWRENPFVLTFTQCLATADADLKAFAESLDESWEFVDLRDPKLGDGYSWGKYGPKTLNRRYGDKRIFARQMKSYGRRFLDAFRRS
jgi:SMI1 / KNR4 family (SUKH-1)